MKDKKFALFSLGFVLIVISIVICVRMLGSNKVDSEISSVSTDGTNGKTTTSSSANDGKILEQITEKKENNTSQSYNLQGKDAGDKTSLSSSSSDKDKNKPSLTLTNPRSITPKGDFMSPRWSPDGLDVLYSKAKYKGLYLVSYNGTGARELSSEDGIGYGAKWSKDGSKLIVEKDGEKKSIDLSGEESSDVNIESDPVFAKDDNIYYTNPETGEQEALTNGEDRYFDPKLSPDGTKIAYQGLTSGIYIKDIRTGEIIEIGNGNNYQWAPDGRGIIYNISQDDGMNLLASDIYYITADGSQKYNLTNTPDIIEKNPNISPDGKKITYEVDGQIFVADINKSATD